MTDLDRLWRLKGPRVRTLQQAARFISDAGYVHLFPGKTPGPSLWQATAETPEMGLQWGPEAERVWGWKDELPLRGLAWFGPFRGFKLFLSPELLALLYPGGGKPSDHTAFDLSPDASAICKVLEDSGPTSQAVLKEAVRLEGKAAAPRFYKAVKLLGQNLLLTHHGIEEQGTGWPSAVFELTSRAFTVPAKGDPDSRARQAAAIYLATMGRVDPRMLGRAFGWRVPQARTVLKSLAERGVATAEGDHFSPAPKETPARKRSARR